MKWSGLNQGSNVLWLNSLSKGSEICLMGTHSLNKVAKWIKKYVDQGKHPLGFVVGDKVWLKLTLQILKHITNKKVHQGLIQKYNESFEVMKRVGKVTYWFTLSEKMENHPTFQISFIKPYYENGDLTRLQAKKAPPTFRVQHDRQIETILDHHTLGKARRIERSNI